MAEPLRAVRAPAGPSTARDLDAALDAGLLTVAYQPVVSLTSGKVIAAEALARLRDAETGQLLAPDAFIPLAEASGRIARIDRMVLAEAAAVTTRLRAVSPRPFSIGVNLSVAGLSQAGLVEFIATTCRDNGLPPDLLNLEITETVLSDPDTDHAEVLRALDELGCNVTLDDFGTGYSSLSHLTRFPITAIKIDRRFVWDLGSRGLGGLVALALVRLGGDLGLDVVAEGVETPEQLSALTYAGCPFAQGYLISRPVPAAEMAAFLQASSGGVPLPRAEQQP